MCTNELIQGKNRKLKVWGVAEIRRIALARSELWGLLERTAKEVANLVQKLTVHTDSEQDYKLREGRRKCVVRGLTVLTILLPSDLSGNPLLRTLNRKYREPLLGSLPCAILAMLCYHM